MSNKFRNFLQGSFDQALPTAAKGATQADIQVLFSDTVAPDALIDMTIVVKWGTPATYEIMKVTANTGTQITVMRASEGEVAGAEIPSGATFTNELTAGQLKLLEGEYEDLEPATDGSGTLGTATKRLASVHADLVDVNGVSLSRPAAETGAVAVNMPNAAGTLALTSDIPMEDAGCIEGTLCVDSTGAVLPSGYALAGGARGNAVYLMEYKGGANSRDCRILARQRAYLVDVFGSGTPDSGTYIADGGATFNNITVPGVSGNQIFSAIKIPDPSGTPDWHEMTFQYAGSATRAQFLEYLKARTLSAAGSDPGGSLVVQGAVYINGTLHFKGGVTGQVLTLTDNGPEWKWPRFYRAILNSPVESQPGNTTITYDLPFGTWADFPILRISYRSGVNEMDTPSVGGAFTLLHDGNTYGYGRIKLPNNTQLTWNEPNAGNVYLPGITAIYNP